MIVKVSEGPLQVDSKVKICRPCEHKDVGIAGTVIKLEWALGNVYQVATIRWADGPTTNIRVSNIEDHIP